MGCENAKCQMPGSTIFHDGQGLYLCPICHERPTTERYEAIGRARELGAFAERLRRREEIGKAISSLFARDEETGLYNHALYRGQWQDLAEAWCQRFPRRKKTAARETASAWKAMRREADAGNFPELQEIHAGYEALAKELIEALNKARDAVNEELSRMAEGLEVPKGSFWETIGAARESSHYTQGLGAERYARAEAEEIADKAHLYGLETQIHKVEDFRYEEKHWRGWSMGECIRYRYEVKALTTPLGASILEWKPGPTLRERVKACWARGINPRVAMWWLPHGYEEREGLDFFGGEVKA